jgi:Phage major capsid protein E
VLVRQSKVSAHDATSPRASCLAPTGVGKQFARWVMLHVQSNPLPICTRPRVLIKGKRT